MPAVPPLHDYRGAVHVHSVHSDGTGTVPEIASAAADCGLDFVMLCDHDTVGARDVGEQRYYGPVLVAVGSEVTPRHRDHVLALGVERAVPHLGRTPRGIVDEVRRRGGIAFLAHPFSQGKGIWPGHPFRDLECTGYAGLEVWSLATDELEGARSLTDVVRGLRAPRDYLAGPPARNLELWDRLCRQRQVVGIAGIDAHQGGLRIAGRVPLRVMSYRRSFELVQTHLLLPTPLTGRADEDCATIFATLARGHCYMAFDGLAPAKGFRFWAERAGSVAQMGDRGEPGRWTLRAELPRRADLTLIRDGEPVYSAGSTDELVLGGTAQGAYRLEARLTHAGHPRSWVLSNPIYLR